MSQNLLRQVKQKFLILDDHELVLGGTIEALRQQYPDAEILTARTAQSAQNQIEEYHPDLVVVDLSVPETSEVDARLDTGIQLIETLMDSYPNLNIVVQSAHVRSLVRLKPAIDAHEGGFTVADKTLPIKEMLAKVDWALQGLIYTPKEMRAGLEFKPEWLEVLNLAFEEGLQDKTIAERMCVAERTVRHYWTKIQDALGVYPEPGKNIRIQTEMRARE